MSALVTTGCADCGVPGVRCDSPDGERLLRDQSLESLGERLALEGLEALVASATGLREPVCECCEDTRRARRS